MARRRKVPTERRGLYTAIDAETGWPTSILGRSPSLGSPSLFLLGTLIACCGCSQPQGGTAMVTSTRIRIVAQDGREVADLYASDEGSSLLIRNRSTPSSLELLNIGDEPILRIQKGRKVRSLRFEDLPEASEATIE